MERKIAVPLENGKLSSHFGHSTKFAIIETNNGSIMHEKILVPPPHEPGVLPAWLAQHGVTDVIAGGMGQRAIGLFHKQNINVFVGAPEKDSKELALDLIHERLEAGANYCDH